MPLRWSLHLLASRSALLSLLKAAEPGHLHLNRGRPEFRLPPGAVECNYRTAPKGPARCGAEPLRYSLLSYLAATFALRQKPTPISL